MCGIAGYIGPETRGYDDAACLSAMSEKLRHRGPDDAGLWLDRERGVGLAHRRLAILDLSAEGHQPMISRSGRYVVAFNGEIYNFRELQKELVPLGHQFRGHSDTEVMLACFEQWGLKASLQRFSGMFALALWDRQEGTLSLARDRAGEKPLYYGWCGDTFLFGSELKALRRHPNWNGGLDLAALNLYFRYTYIPGPLTIHPGIAKLTPGCFLTVDRKRSRQPAPQQYWSVLEVARAGERDQFQGSDAEAVAAVESALSRAVSRQMVSDVPLGAFLSGGYDSSTVVALMQAQSSTPVRTFTIGFQEKEFNEARHARSIAERLGTDHCELYVTEKECLDVIPLLPALYDEPFADSSQIPTYLLAQLARQQVTVSLSGDAGDELFCGYNRYDLAENFWGRISALPHPLRWGASSLVRSTPVSLLDSLCALAGQLAPGMADLHGDRLHRLAQLLGAQTPERLAEMMVSYDRWADSIVKGGALGSHKGEARDGGRISGSAGPADGRENYGSCVASHMMLADFLRYLPDDILVKVDRAAMGVSLETRIPLLDPELIELVWRLPMHLKRRNGDRKWILRQVLYRYVPRELVERPKMGFGVPVDLWIRGPLRDWAESLLSESALAQSGLLHPAPVRKKWLEHQSGKYNWNFELWPVLMFQAWLQDQ